MIKHCPVCKGTGIGEEAENFQCGNCNGEGFTADTGEEWHKEKERRGKKMNEPICQECGFPPDDCICSERWILVEKELPPLRTAFWVWDGKTVDENRLGRNNKDDDIYRKYLQSRGITHWMLRIKPQPPEGGGNER
jgi:hypothetical protein